MYLHLHNLTIHLHSDTPFINQQWRYLFAGWLGQAEAVPDMQLCLQQQSYLSPLPDTPPFFTDSHSLPDNVGILSVYRDEGEYVLLHYLDGALVRVPLPAGLPIMMPVVDGVLTEKVLHYGRFEDVTFTSLAPLLRRHGYYLVHAFAASKNGRAVMVVGPSGSGKTTTGLNLVLNGWQLLSNDILLLEQRPEGIYALPTPGAVSIRAGTLALLPQLASQVETAVAVDGKYQVTGEALINGCWSSPVPIDAICFPQVTNQEQSVLKKQNRAVALVHLMEESIDRWDEVTLSAHINLLQLLIQQATPYQLYLGQDMIHMHTLLEQLVSV